MIPETNSRPLCRLHPRLLAIAAATLLLGACAGAQDTWVKADSDEQELRSALYWCGQQVPNSAFIKFGTSEQKERGKTLQTSVDEDCMRKKGWSKAGK